MRRKKSIKRRQMVDEMHLVLDSYIFSYQQGSSLEVLTLLIW